MGEALLRIIIIFRLNIGEKALLIPLKNQLDFSDEIYFLYSPAAM